MSGLAHSERGRASRACRVLSATDSRAPFDSLRAPFETLRFAKLLRDAALQFAFSLLPSRLNPSYLSRLTF